VQDKIGDQRMKPIRVNSRNRASRETYPQVAEQVDSHGR
jgi:hypothetical protein